MSEPIDAATIAGRVLQELPAEKEPGDNRVYLALRASALVTGWPKTLSNRDLEFLNMLCRKIEVTKKLFSLYEPNWKHPQTPVPLPTSFFPVIVAVLLLYPVFPGGDKGQALKQLSAAFTLIDRASEAGRAGLLSGLRRYAEERLALLTTN